MGKNNIEVRALRLVSGVEVIGRVASQSELEQITLDGKFDLGTVYLKFPLTNTVDAKGEPAFMPYSVFGVVDGLVSFKEHSIEGEPLEVAQELYEAYIRSTSPIDVPEPSKIITP